MSFVEFLLEYYFYILAVLIVLIVGVIGFLVDSKNKNNKKNVVKDESKSIGGQVVSNVEPLQGIPINNDLNNGLANMQPIGGENLIQNQLQPQIQNNDMYVNDVVSASTGIVDDQNASEVSNNNILGMEPINNIGGSDLNISNQAFMTSIQPNLSNVQASVEQVIQPIQTIESNNEMNRNGVNNNLGGISDISVLQGGQPIMQNNNISNDIMSLGGNPIGIQNMQPDVMNMLVNPIGMQNMQPDIMNMSVNPIGMQNMQPDVMNMSVNPIGMQNMQPDVTNMLANSMSNLNTQSQINSNINQSLNNQVQVSSNDINNSVGAINGINLQPNIPNAIPLSPIMEGIPQVNNQNFNVGNNMTGVSTNVINNNVQPIPTLNMSNTMGQMNGQVYTANDSQPFDISSMFGNNKQ